MKDPTGEILAAVKTMLDGYLTVSNVNYKVIDALHKMESYHHVHLKSIEAANESPQDEYLMLCTLTIDIIDGGQHQQPSIIAINSIANQINQLIVDKNITMSSFELCGKPYLGRIMGVVEDIKDNDILLTKTLIYNFYVQQK